MHKYTFALAAVLALAIAIPSRAGEKPRIAQENQNQSKRVWTNEDLDQLRARGLISIVGSEAAQTPNQTEVAPSETRFPVYNSRLQDPEWYAEKAAELQAELQTREAALRQQQTAMTLATERITQPGIAMDKPNAGVTPEAGVANLQAQVNEVQSELDRLSELARVNNVTAGI